MKPVTPEPRPETVAVVFAKDQPQYIPLPVNIRRPCLETKWQLTWWERITVLLRGELYIKVLVFDNPLQPLKPTVRREATL